MTAEQLVSIAEAARNIGVNRSTLWRQVVSGQIRNWAGQVRLSEVIADRAANVRPPVGAAQRRAGSAPPIQSVHASPEPLHAPAEQGVALVITTWLAGIAPDRV